MKVIIFVLFALVAVSSAGVIVPSALSYSYSSPLVAPWSYPYVAAPVTYAAAPVAYAATPVVPAVQSGYVAATRGSLHTAPLPEGPLAFSHHINTAPAPGTL